MTGRPSWNLSPCGTDAAYRRHYRRGEKPCQRCIDAHGLALSERRAARGATEPRARDDAGRYAATGRQP